MRRVSLAIIMLFTSPVTAAVPTAMSGGDLYRMCVISKSGADQAACSAYMVGLRDGLTIQKVASPQQYSICLPPDGDVLQMRAAIENYLHDHPEKNAVAADGLSVIALHQAFPCKTN